jgi:8-oxo-dGTP pyrophosphatase MutT (NUDIX family)
LTDFTSLESFLADRLRQPLPGAAAQRRFAPHPARKGWEPDQRPAGARHASALVLIYPGDAGPTLPLTVRHDDLPHHPGQISLPGGGLDAGESPLDAALREAEEEIGVSPVDVCIVGALSPLWVVVSGFIVFPFVGIVDRRPEFRLAEREVSELVEAPLATLRDPAHTGWAAKPRDGVLVRFPYFDVGGHHVWGATAMMLGEFVALFDPDFRPA